MDSNLAAAIVSAGGTTLVAISALVINSKRLDDLSRRMDRLESRLDQLNEKLDAKFEHIEQLLAGHALDIVRIKEKLGIS